MSTGATSTASTGATSDCGTGASEGYEHTAATITASHPC